MQNHERQLLQENIEQLAKAINFDEVSNLLLIRKTFNQTNIDLIKSYKDDYICNLMLLTDLQTRGPDAFHEFVDVLKLIKCTQALKLFPPDILVISSERKSRLRTPSLDKVYPLGMQTNTTVTKADGPSLGRSQEPFDDHDSAERPTTLGVRNDASYQTSSIQQSIFTWKPFSNHSPDEIAKSKDCLITTDHKPDFSAQESSSSQSSQNSVYSYQNMAADYFSPMRKLTVKKAETCHDNPKQDYKFTSRPRGPCLIINNVDFDSDVLPRRHGSDEDSKILQDVFYQVGFEVHHERNLTAGTMKKTFSKLVSACRQEHDALFLIILSHGSESGIYGTDGVELDLNDIMSYFDNRRCKTMIGKPKVFIIQSCKGRLSNYLSSEDSTDSAACSPDSPPQLHPQLFPNCENRIIESRSSESTKSSVIHAIRTDMLLCFSCVPGYSSAQDEAGLGPGLSKVLAYYIETRAWEKDFQRILAMVSRDIERRSSSGGFTEAIEINCLGWSKYLYLNPGIYR